MKVGDKCFSGGGYYGYRLERIERETKTQWVLASGKRYRKDTLREVGYYYSILHSYSQEIVDSVELTNRTRELRTLLHDLFMARNKIEVTNIDTVNDMISKAKEILQYTELGD